RARPLQGPPQGDRRAAQVRREARRPGHPPGPGGLRAGGLLATGGRRPVKTRSLRWVAALAALLALLGMARTVSAQSARSSLLPVGELDTSDPAANSVTFFSSNGVSGATVSVNGAAVQPTAIGPLPTTRSMGVALVFDTSEDMDKSGALAAAKE